MLPPEIFESVTIFFSDIVEFETLMWDSAAVEIVDFLNDLCKLSALLAAEC